MDRKHCSSEKIEAFLKSVNASFENKIWTRHEMEYVSKNILKFKIPEVLKVGLFNPLERRFRENNIQELFYRLTDDSQEVKNEQSTPYGSTYITIRKMSDGDGLNSKLSDLRKIFFQGWVSIDNNSKKLRREIIAISDNDLLHDEMKFYEKDRSIVEILEANRDYLRAESIYSDQNGNGTITGASKRLYPVMGSSGKYADIEYVEVEFRSDLTRKIRLM